MSQVWCCIRTKLIDDEAKKFIEKNPDCVVIQLWAWLDARFERLWKPNITHWYDLDLPESIEIRKQFFTESEKNTFLNISLFDYDWIWKVKSHNKPVLIIVEWVFMYFDEKELKWFFNKLCEEFDNASILFDMLFFWWVNHHKYHDSLKEMRDETPFKWSLLNTKDMEKWNKKIHIWTEKSMVKNDNNRYILIYRLICKIPYFRKRLDQRVVKIDIY